MGWDRVYRIERVQSQEVEGDEGEILDLPRDGVGVPLEKEREQKV